MSCRPKEFVPVADESETSLCDFFVVFAELKMKFTQGGATLQFAAIQLKILGTEFVADYSIACKLGVRARKEGEMEPKGNEIHVHPGSNGVNLCS